MRFHDPKMRPSRIQMRRSVTPVRRMSRPRPCLNVSKASFEIDAVPLRSIRASAEFVRFKPTGMRTITRSVSKLSRSGGTLGSVRSMPVQAPPRPSITGLRPFACAARNASRVAESFTLGCCAMTRSSGTWAASNRSRLSWDQKSIALIASARDAQHPQPRCWGHRARIIRPQPDAIPKMAIGREC